MTVPRRPLVGADPVTPDTLLARIAATEAVARAATRGRWALDEDDTAVRGARGAGPSVCTTVPLGYERRRANAAHIALNDPARVLAVCAGAKTLVELADEVGREPCHPETLNLADDILAAVAAMFAEPGEES